MKRLPCGHEEKHARSSRDYTWCAMCQVNFVHRVTPTPPPQEEG